MTTTPLKPIKPIKMFDFGAGELHEIEYLERVFAIPRRTAMLYLKALRIKPLYIGQGIFFSLPTFKRILYVLTKPDSPGFLFPGAAKRKDNRTRNEATKGDYLTAVTDEILKKAADPITLAEMQAAAGRDLGVLKKLVSVSEDKKEAEVKAKAKAKAKNNDDDDCPRGQK